MVASLGNAVEASGGAMLALVDDGGDIGIPALIDGGVTHIRWRHQRGPAAGRLAIGRQARRAPDRQLLRCRAQLPCGAMQWMPCSGAGTGAERTSPFSPALMESLALPPPASIIPARQLPTWRVRLDRPDRAGAYRRRSSAMRWTTPCRPPSPAPCPAIQRAGLSSDLYPDPRGFSGEGGRAGCNTAGQFARPRSASRPRQLPGRCGGWRRPERSPQGGCGAAHRPWRIRAGEQRLWLHGRRCDARPRRRPPDASGRRNGRTRHAGRAPCRHGIPHRDDRRTRDARFTHRARGPPCQRAHRRDCAPSSTPAISSFALSARCGIANAGEEGDVEAQVRRAPAPRWRRPGGSGAQRKQDQGCGRRERHRR